MQYYIYKITNIVNGKTMCPVESRIEEVKQTFNYRCIDDVQGVCQ